MQQSIFKRSGTRLMAWTAIGLLVFLVIALVACAEVAEPDRSVESERTTEPGPATSDDCFGGTLSDDPLHCEVLEWAHNEGVIEVEGVYRAGNALFIYLVQDELLNKTALDRILAKAREVAGRLGRSEYACVLHDELCDVGILIHPDSWYILPLPSGYDDVEFILGGVEARRSFTGWRAFEQYWPDTDEDASGVSGTIGNFDISGVDRTNFPSLRGCSGTHCLMWDTFPSLEIASYFRDSVADREYFHIKVVAGEDEAVKIATAERELMASQPEYLTEDRLVVVPVPHDYEELWRWALVLDRFANSSGNTLGITRADIGNNGENWHSVVFPVDNILDARNLENEYGEPDKSKGTYIPVYQPEAIPYLVDGDAGRVFLGDAAGVLPALDVRPQLIVTSPPYDNLRTYGGHGFDFDRMADALVAVMPEGGVLVWVVADATVDGSETGTSFRQALGFMERGLKLHDTMIYHRSSPFTYDRRYKSEFEYMLVLVNGTLKTANLLHDRPSTPKRQGPAMAVRNRNGNIELRQGRTTPAFSTRGNVWHYYHGRSHTTDSHHPTTFPYALAADHIRTWSNPGDIVLDPMAGSGTTLRAAKDLNRQYVGIEIHEPYCELIRDRMAQSVLPIA